MSEFDFTASVKPDGRPHKEGFEPSNIESDLKGVFNELFALLGKDTFDAGVLGAAHLGSFDLVRRSINQDGLVLLSGDREEAATRYLYRAWKSGDTQKRGLHFVRTYLQLLFPGQTEVKQLWHSKSEPYGTAFVTNEPRNPYWFHFLGEDELKLDGSWKVGRPLSLDGIEPPEHKPDEDDLFLTSRIEILLGLEAIADGYNPIDMKPDVSATTGLISIIRSVVPARLIPEFRFWLRFILAVNIRTSSNLLMQKHSNMRYPWCGRVLTENDDAKWQLGKDGDIVKLGLPLGSFRLSERRGGSSSWKLKQCRIESSLLAKIPAQANVFGVQQLGVAGLKLDGSWRLGKPQMHASGSLSMDKRVTMTQKVELETTFHEHIEIKVPSNPTRLGRHPKLTPWARLDGQWSLGETEKKLNGFKLMRGKFQLEQEISAQIESDTKTYATMAISTLQKDSIRQLKLRNRTLNGDWCLGSTNRIGQFKLDGTRLRNRKMTQFNPLGSFRLSMNEISGLGYTDAGQVARVPLNGSWKLGTRMAPPEFSMAITKV